jgi:endonuclease YncB( thermonuclease family)
LSFNAIILAVLVVLVTPAHAQDFSCAVASVTDGNTFRCADGKRIRVHGIDAPEMDTRQGPASQAALVGIIGGKALVCEQTGTTYDRIAAICLLDGHDIAALMVQRAQARGSWGDPPLLRSERRYIWSKYSYLDPVPRRPP